MLRGSKCFICAFIPGKGMGESSRLGWPPACTTHSSRFGGISFCKGPWTCWPSAEQGCHPPVLPAGVPIPTPYAATGPAAAGLGQCWWVFLVSILEG